jgi:hypothetical protein
MCTETWKDVIGYEGLYAVSNLGRVKRLRRVVDRNNQWGKHKLELKERILRGSINKQGYVIVELLGSVRVGVHRLVLESFVGPCPDGMFGRHLDGNPANNRIDNLRWGSVTENNRDKILHGTITRGESVNTSKLTTNQVREIRTFMERPLSPGRIRRRRSSVSKLASKYGVRASSVYQIFNRKSWKHVQ